MPVMFPHPTRLYWEDNKGSARLNGRVCVLTMAPILHGQPVEMVEYLPLGVPHQ